MQPLRRSQTPLSVRPFDKSLLKRRLQEVGVLASGALATVSGVAQLLVTGPGRVALVALSIVAAVFLCVRLVQGYFLDRVQSMFDEIVEMKEELRRQVALLAQLEEKEQDLIRQVADREQLVAAVREQARELNVHRAAIERIVARQYHLFEEEVEITVTIGATAGEDLIVERHRTAPKPFLVYRVVQLITAKDTAITTFKDLRCEHDGPDEVPMTLLPLSETNRGVQLLIVFQPGLDSEKEWTLTYRPPRLWDPLRENRVDYLGWTPLRSLDWDHWEGRPFGSVTVHFVFPPGAGGRVREASLRGTQVEQALPTGQKKVTWVDRASTTRRYHWDLAIADVRARAA